jgi:adenosine deaminase
MRHTTGMRRRRANGKRRAGFSSRGPLAVRPLLSVMNVAQLPKADLHLHAETDGRVERIQARREGRSPFDWLTWARDLQRETPPGFARLEAWIAHHALPSELVESLDARSDMFVERVADVIREAAADGAILVEVRFGSGTGLRSDFMPLFREAELRVQREFPTCQAEAIISGLTPARPDRWDRVLPRCLDLAREGLGGIDIIPEPYASEADWRGVAQWTARVDAAGLGITVHAGEFSRANIGAACALPGVTRLGHAVFTATDPQLLDAVRRAGVTIECCVSCNVLLGAVGSVEEHPIRALVEHGIPVTLNSDDPVHVGTTIGREYEIAASSLGFSEPELLEVTRTAIRASFTSPERRAALFDVVDQAAAASSRG